MFQSGARAATPIGIRRSAPLAARPPCPTGPGAGRTRDGQSYFFPVTIDTTAPRLLSTVAETPTGDYGAGADLAFAVHFSERVRPSEIPPVLALSDGTIATYAGGSGTSTLLFTRAVTTGEAGTDVVPTGFAANGAQILDVAGNAADLSNVRAAPTGIDVDGGPVSAPTVAAITAAVSSGKSAAQAGDTITYTVATTSPIDVLLPPDATPPSLLLSDGSSAAYAGQDANGSLLFTRTVTASDATGTLSVAGFDPGTGHLVTPPSVGFSAPETLATGTRPTSVVVADVNGDGIPDIVSASRGTLSVLLGNADGTFQPAVDTRLPFSALFNVETVDLHGTGQPEIVVDGDQSIQRQGTDGSSLSDFYTYTALDAFQYDAATGTFVNHPSYTSAPVAGGRDASIVDVNLDGRLDVVGPSYNVDNPGAYTPPTPITFTDPVTGTPVQGSTGAVNAEPPDAISITYALDMLADAGGTLGGHSPWQLGRGSCPA